MKNFLKTYLEEYIKLAFDDGIYQTLEESGFLASEVT